MTKISLQQLVYALELAQTSYLYMIAHEYAHLISKHFIDKASLSDEYFKEIFTIKINNKQRKELEADYVAYVLTHHLYSPLFEAPFLAPMIALKVSDILSNSYDILQNREVSNGEIGDSHPSYANRIAHLYIMEVQLKQNDIVNYGKMRLYAEHCQTIFRSYINGIEKILYDFAKSRQKDGNLRSFYGRFV